MFLSDSLACVVALKIITFIFIIYNWANSMYIYIYIYMYIYIYIYIYMIIFNTAQQSALVPKHSDCMYVYLIPEKFYYVNLLNYA